MKCDVCGHQVDDNEAVFCIYCGRRIIRPVVNEAITVETGVTEKLTDNPVMQPVRNVITRPTVVRQPDDYYQKLPSIIDEMRSNESQIVKPIQWLLSCIMLYIPLIGTLYFLIGCIKAKRAAKRNLRYNANKSSFAKTALIVSICYLLILGLGAFIYVKMFILHK